MKYFIMIMAMITITSATEWHDPKLPMADETKPVYQPKIPGLFGIGGYWEPVRIPTKADYKDMIEYERQMAEQRQRAKDLASVSRWIKIGIIAFLLGMVVHAMNSLPILDRISEYVMAGGCLSVVAGMIFRWMVTHEQLMLYLVVIPLIVAGLAAMALSRPGVKQWSVTHGFKWLLGKKEPKDPIDEWADKQVTMIKEKIDNEILTSVTQEELNKAIINNIREMNDARPDDA